MKPQTNTRQSQPSSPFLFATAQRPHPEHPERTEDALIVDRPYGLAVVCDGVGSTTGAELAAQLATRTVKSRWRQCVAQSLNAPPHLEPNQETVAHLLEETNSKVLALGKRLIKKQTKDNEQGEKAEYAKTTIVLAIVCQQQTGTRMVFGHVGDSRIYLLRSNETLRRGTHDDGYFLLMQNKGELDEQAVWRIEQASSMEQLSEEERAHFANRNGITQALGDEKLSIHTGELDLFPGDCILLCSDGIHDNLTDKEIEIILSIGTPRAVAALLVAQAMDRALQGEGVNMRAKKDDMSAIVIACGLLPLPY